MENKEDINRATIREYMKRKNVKVTPWTRDAGISEGTLRNYLKGISKTLNMASLQKLADAHGVSIYLKDGLLVIDENQSSEETDLDLNSAKIKGYVQAGLWGSADEEYLPEEEQKPVPIFGNFPYKSVYGLIVKGDSMDKIYEEGDLLLCVNIWEYGRENIKPGANLIIKAISTSDEIETTVKKLEVDNNGHLWLVPQCKTEGKYKKYPVPNIEDIDDLSIKINGKTIKRISVDAYVYSSTRLSSR